MSRNRILAAGVLLWAVAALDMLIHITSGDWLGPSIAVVMGIAFVAVRMPRRARLEAA
jgi:hypothetical protein